MATKTERFRAAQERANQAGRPPDGGHQSAGVRAGRRGRRKDRLPNPTSHNEAVSSNGKARRYALEPSLTSRPTRKLTRISPAHEKTDSPLRMRRMMRMASPAERAVRKN